MGDRTPRLGLHTFEPGEPWDHTDTVEAVDKHAIAHGPIADRPQEGEYDDELFHATDQGITWRWDAASEDWEFFGGQGNADQPVPGTSHFEETQAARARFEETQSVRAEFEKTESVQARFEESQAVHSRTKQTPVWNVEAHGIVGDGRTEVGHAVDELFGDVANAGGGIVYFPPGRYCFERTPLIGDDTMVVGAGPSTVFEGTRPDQSLGAALLSNEGYDTTGYGGASNWGVRDIRIDSPKSNGIMPAHAENVRLENIYGEHIRFHHIDIVSSKNVIVDGYWASRGGEGDSNAPMQFDNQNPGTERNQVRAGGATSPAATGETPTKNCTLRNFEIDPENTPKFGVHLHRNGNRNLRIEDGYVSGCQEAAIRADTDVTVRNLQISGVSCIDNVRGISTGKAEGGRGQLKISDVTIRTDDENLAGGSGLYVSGFTGAAITNVTVDGEFENSCVFDHLTDLKIHTMTVTGGRNQGFRLREDIDATLSNSRAEDCGGTGLYISEDSTAAYGGLSFRDVGNEVTIDGEWREW